jgi:hypothetical protein
MEKDISKTKGKINMNQYFRFTDTLENNVQDNIFEVIENITYTSGKIR